MSGFLEGEMSILYERWDWQFDRGVNPLAEGTPLPARFATAHYDRLGRLYRVEVREPATVSEDGGATETDLYVYDYFCDARGRVIQKRSLGPNHEVELIVDYEYEAEGSRVTEIAWSASCGTCKRVTRLL